MANDLLMSDRVEGFKQFARMLIL